MQNLEFLFAAFMVIWLLIFGYMYSIGRRQKALEREMQQLRQLHEEQTPGK